VNPAGYLDTLGLWEATAAIPERMSDVLASLVDVASGDLVAEVGRVRMAVVLGVGASGTVADAAEAYGATSGRVPVLAVTGPDLPAFVGPDALVLAVSTSGETPETLTAAATAVARGAQVVVVSPDGGLAELAESTTAARLALRVDDGVRRASMGSALVLVLGVLSALGLVDDTVGPLTAAIPVLQRRRDVLAAPQGPADELARRIGRTIPLVYGGAGLSGVAARHWKRQFNENVKTPAFWGVVPEVAHDEVSGWGQHGDITRQVMTLIALRQPGEDPMVVQRFDHVLDAVDEVMVDVLAVWAEGQDDLARFVDLVLLGDYVSLHLAGREGIDPGPLAVQPQRG
jgi:glucose/mannose-6-phosphate isomerase